MPNGRDYRSIENSVDELDSTENVPWMYRWSRISHYYGDSVRQFLIAAAALMLLTAPFYTDDLYVELPFIVVGTVILVCIAALTNPYNRSIISADVIAAGVGLVIFEMWALLGYADGTLLQFIFREALAVVFLFALYYSTKTLRSMLLNQVGKRDTREDLRTPDEPQTIHGRRARAMERELEEREDIKEDNRHIKHEFED